MTSTALSLSGAAGNVIAASFLSSNTTMGNFVDSPVSTIFVCLSFIDIHQQLNLCILSWQSLRSTPRLCTNTSKLVIKINSGVFVDLADLLAALKCVRNSGSMLTWMTNSLVATAKKRAVEISCILVWIQAFTICQWTFWSTYHSCWWDTT